MWDLHTEASFLGVIETLMSRQCFEGDGYKAGQMTASDLRSLKSTKQRQELGALIFRREKPDTESVAGVTLVFQLTSLALLK